MKSKSILQAVRIRGDVPDTAILLPLEHIFIATAGQYSITPKKFPFLQIAKYGVYGDKLITGPFIGAPMAVMLLESLAISGVKNFILIGSCGSISTSLGIGDIVIPNEGIPEEGTSVSYVSREFFPVPSPVLFEKLKVRLSTRGFSCKTGKVWTTDAPFRETYDKVQSYANRGAISVDMEFSGLATAANFLGVNFAAAMVVSDECFREEWKKGFSNKKLNKELKRLCQTLIES